MLIFPVVSNNLSADFGVIACIEEREIFAVLIQDFPADKFVRIEFDRLRLKFHLTLNILSKTRSAARDCALPATKPKQPTWSTGAAQLDAAHMQKRWPTSL